MIIILMKGCYWLCLGFVTFAQVSRLLADDPAKPDDKIEFAGQVKPIIQERCVFCHNQKTLPSQHSFETAELAMKGDKIGPIIVPGNPDASRFILAITVPNVHEKAMPPVSSRITKDEIETLKEWILQGAIWPKGVAGRIVPTLIPKE